MPITLLLKFSFLIFAETSISYLNCVGNLRMDDEFYSIEKESNDISTKGEYPIQNTSSQPTNVSSTDQNAKHSVIDMNNEQSESNGANEPAVPVCNPADVMPRLLKSYRKRTIYTLLPFLVITIGSMIVSSACFVFALQDSIKDLNKIESLIFGSILGLISIIALIILSSQFYSLYDGFHWVNNVLQIIPLDGTLWQRQVNLIQATVPRNMYGPCVPHRHDRNRMRPDGCIIVTDVGIIIDELIGFQYDISLPIQVDLVYNIIQTGWIIRLFLARSSNFKNAFKKGKYKILQVDLLMPPSMQVDQVNAIREMILSSSHKYVVESEFYGASPPSTL